MANTVSAQAKNHLNCTWNSINGQFKYKKVAKTHLGAPARTAIVNALSLGIPPSVVMKWTGHSDYNAMKPYIDIVDSIKAESMTKFNNLL